MDVSKNLQALSSESKTKPSIQLGRCKNQAQLCLTDLTSDPVTETYLSERSVNILSDYTAPDA
jgi:hypothetical protein